MPLIVGDSLPNPSTSKLITRVDLEAVPGITGAAEQLDYAAWRASATVMGAWCNPVTPTPDDVKGIAIDVAARYLANPRGRSSITYSRSLDDASRSETERFEGAANRGGFYLTDDERQQLAGAGPTESRARMGWLI